MSNQLYNMLGNHNNQFSNMVSQFEQFRSNFQGNPKEEVEKLLRSGRMTQSQLNQLQQMAQAFQQLLRK